LTVRFILFLPLILNLIGSCCISPLNYYKIFFVE